LSESITFTPHTTAKGGITALTVSKSESSDSSGAYVLSGGLDKVAIISNKEGTVLGKLSGHSKKITDVSFHVSEGLSGPFFTASADKTVKVNL
jgi:WD40 repeat protein